MKNLIKCVLPVVSVFLIFSAGCYIDGEDETNYNAYIKIQNNSTNTFNAARIGPSTNPTWGDNLLNTGETINPGISRTFTVDLGEQVSVAYDWRFETTVSTFIAGYNRLLIAEKTTVINVTNAGWTYE